MANPDISILISIHNGEKTIDRCFESIKNQTFGNYEIICVDDYSNDNSLVKMENWQKIFGKDKFILIKNNENLGVPKSSNIGLSKISTQYTARIDADDWWHPDKLKIQMDYLNSYSECGVLGCNYYNVKNNKKIKVFKPETDKEIRNKLLKINPFGHSCVIFNTEIAKSIGGYDETIKYGSDYDFLIRFYEKTRYYNLQDFFCYRLIQESGISFKKQREQKIQGIKTRIKYINKLNFPIINYLYISNPLLSVITPDIIKKLKRKLI